MNAPKPQVCSHTTDTRISRSTTLHHDHDHTFTSQKCSSCWVIIFKATLIAPLTHFLVCKQSTEFWVFGPPLKTLVKVFYWITWRRRISVISINSTNCGFVFCFVLLLFDAHFLPDLKLEQVSDQSGLYIKKQQHAGIFHTNATRSKY